MSIQHCRESRAHALIDTGSPPPDCQLLDPQSQAVANGSAVTLTCGLAEATFTQWFSGQLPVPEKTIGVEDDTITTRGGFASLGHLSIFPFKASAHTGKYFCLTGIKGGNALYSCPAELSHASEWVGGKAAG